jgi:hypothetical protein
MSKQDDIDLLRDRIFIMSSVCNEHCSTISALADCALKAMEVPDFFTDPLLVEKLFAAISEACERMRIGIQDTAAEVGCEWKDPLAEKRYAALCASTVYGGRAHG